jgi:Na+-transporting NADH:ubiquinone oxidoreductase subunit NqrB
VLDEISAVLDLYSANDCETVRILQVTVVTGQLEKASREEALWHQLLGSGRMIPDRSALPIAFGIAVSSALVVAMIATRSVTEGLLFAGGLLLCLCVITAAALMAVLTVERRQVVADGQTRTQMGPLLADWLGLPSPADLTEVTYGPGGTPTVEASRLMRRADGPEPACRTRSRRSQGRSGSR